MTDLIGPAAQEFEQYGSEAGGLFAALPPLQAQLQQLEEQRRGLEAGASSFDTEQANRAQTVSLSRADSHPARCTAL